MAEREYDLPERSSELVPSFVRALGAFDGGEVAMFDADGTLWRDDVADDFTRWMIDKGEISGELWERYLEIYRGDHAAGCRFLLKLYTGLSKARLHNSIRRWWREEAKRSWIPEVVETLFHLAESGCEIWIVTGSPSDTMLPLRDFLPVDRIVGMDFELDDAGVVTGSFAGISCADEGKAEKVRALLGERRVVFAAGNGSLDRAMMELSSLSAWAVFPNADFEAVARAKGWPVLPRPEDFVEEDKLADV